MSGPKRRLQLRTTLRRDRVVLPLERIRAAKSPHPLYCPRGEYDPTASILESIRAVGQLQPIKIWVSGENPYRAAENLDEDHTIWVCDGRRRMRAIQELVTAGVHPNEIWIDEVRGPLAAALRVQAEGNSHVPETVLERADKVTRILAADKTLSIAEVGAWYEVTHQTIRNWLSLASTCPAVRDAFDAERLALVTACELSKILTHEQQGDCLAALQTAVAAGEVGSSAAAACAFIKAYPGDGKKGAKGKPAALPAPVWRPSKKTLGRAYEALGKREGKLPLADVKDVVGAILGDEEARERLPAQARTALLEAFAAAVA